MFQLFSRRPNEHVAHEKGMVCTSADDSDVDAILLVPSGEAIDHIDSISSVQIIDRPFAIDLPDLELHC